MVNTNINSLTPSPESEASKAKTAPQGFVPGDSFRKSMGQKQNRKEDSTIAEEKKGKPPSLFDLSKSKPKSQLSPPPHDPMAEDATVALNNDMTFAPAQTNSNQTSSKDWSDTDAVSPRSKSIAAKPSAHSALATAQPRSNTAPGTTKSTSFTQDKSYASSQETGGRQQVSQNFQGSTAKTDSQTIDTADQESLNQSRRVIEKEDPARESARADSVNKISRDRPNLEDSYQTERKYKTQTSERQKDAKEKETSSDNASNQPREKTGPRSTAQRIGTASAQQGKSIESVAQQDELINQAPSPQEGAMNEEFGALLDQGKGGSSSLEMQGSEKGAAAIQGIRADQIDKALSEKEGDIEGIQQDMPTTPNGSKEKQSKSISSLPERGAEAAVTAILGAQQAPVNTDIGQAPQIPEFNRKDMEILVNQLVDSMQVMQKGNITDTAITLKAPPILEGATITLHANTNASNEFNVTFANLTPEAKALIDGKLAQTGPGSLHEAMENKGFVVHIVRTTTQEENLISQAKEQAFQDRRDQQQDQGEQQRRRQAFKQEESEEDQEN